MSIQFGVVSYVGRYSSFITLDDGRDAWWLHATALRPGTRVRVRLKKQYGSVLFAAWAKPVS